MKHLSKIQPEWLLFAAATWHAALVITAASALVIGGWDREFIDFTLKHLLWGLSFWFVGALMRENRRLKADPMWIAVDRAFLDGFQRGAESATKSDEADR